jgi:hypothetical protein
MLNFHQKNDKGIRIETERYFDSLNLKDFKSLISGVRKNEPQVLQFVQASPSEFPSEEVEPEGGFMKAAEEVKHLFSQLQQDEFAGLELGGNSSAQVQGFGSSDRLEQSQSKRFALPEAELGEFFGPAEPLDHVSDRLGINSRAFEFKAALRLSVAMCGVAVLAAGLYEAHSFCQTNGSCLAGVSVPKASLLSFSARSQTPPLNAETFRQAVNHAMRAAELTQTAENEQQWRDVMKNWAEAIYLMQSVPQSSSHYAIAQQKVFEYTNNLNYARQEAKNFGNRLQFRAAVNRAMQAAEMTQTAHTPNEWHDVAKHWTEAIHFMSNVPESSPYYAIAQEKIFEYTSNLNYAKGNVEILASSLQVSFEEPEIGFSSMSYR